MRRYADRVLELEDEAGADRLDDRGRPALLAVGRVGEVVVLERVDVGDRAAADDIRAPSSQQLAVHDEHARGAGPADELVRREEHRVVRRVPSRPDVDVDVGRGGGEVPERERAVLVQQRGDECVSVRMPVTLLAALNEPILSGRSA